MITMCWSGVALLVLSLITSSSVGDRNRSHLPDPLPSSFGDGNRSHTPAPLPPSMEDRKRSHAPAPLPASLLYNSIMGDYEAMIRPSPPLDEKFTVKLALRLSQINFIDEREQILSLSVWLRQEWHDSRLVWDPDQHQGVEVLNIPSDRLWIPDLVLYNNADGDFQVTLRTKALVYHTGLVVWEPPAIYKSYCPINVEFFPFDVQECFLKFSSWTYHGNEVDLQHICNGTVLNPDSVTPELVILRGIDLSSYYYNTEWDILNATATRRVKFYSCCPDPFPDVTFNLTLRRRPLFYTLNLVMPCMAFLGLTVLVFYLPSASGEKVSLAISILLALTLFFLILTEMNPPTSLVVPLLGKYLIFILLVVALSVITTVFIVHVNLKSPSTDRMSPWVRRIFIEILPSLLFMRGPSCTVSSAPMSREELLLRKYGLGPTSKSTRDNKAEADQGAEGPAQCFNLIANMNKIKSCVFSRLGTSSADQEPMSEAFDTPAANSEQQVRPKNDWNSKSDSHPPPADISSSSSSSSLPPVVREALEAVTWISQHLKEEEEDVREERDWAYMGIVLDRLFLWIFATACSIGTLAVFLSAPSLYDPREHLALVDDHNTCVY